MQAYQKVATAGSITGFVILAFLYAGVEINSYHLTQLTIYSLIYLAIIYIAMTTKSKKWAIAGIIGLSLIPSINLRPFSALPFLLYIVAVVLIIIHRGSLEPKKAADTGKEPPI
ncbi:MAG: hypothetical protein MPI91_06770 [Nitrosopumilus sp.]|nr:hypothetical protein [Nitrosopumilus sp.]